MSVASEDCATVDSAHKAAARAAAAAGMSGADDFYVRYYVGHKGKFGHEFLEFEFRPDGKVSMAAA